MTLQSKYLGVLVGLALAQTASAQQISKPLSSLAANSVTGTILCRSGSTVPMTADAEQSLPLRLVATLNCGQQVSLLSASEGYTVNVRTAEGKSGYVAWMNVTKAEIAPSQKAEPTAPIRDGVARWIAGTPGSERLYSEGSLVESLTVNGITVQVSLQDTGWKLLANIAVANRSLEGVNVIPSHIELSDLSLKKKSLAYQDPNKLRGAASHQILWTTSNATPSSSGYLASSTRQPFVEFASTSRTQNYLAEHQTTVQLVSDHQAEFNPHSQMHEVALKETVVLPNQQISGSAWFQRKGHRDDMTLSVPVGVVIFEFPLSFNEK
jgi:hypothetical protein